jgi:hypothetical protein
MSQVHNVTQVPVHSPLSRLVYLAWRGAQELLGTALRAGHRPAGMGSGRQRSWLKRGKGLLPYSRPLRWLLEWGMDNVEQQINTAADMAIVNAMYRYTFGIVANGKGASVGRGLGAGVGVLWRNSFVVVTAAHTMETTPDEDLFFLLPSESIQVEGSGISAHPAQVTVKRRVQLERQNAFLDDERDLAAFILPNQIHETASKHFYYLDDLHKTPSNEKQVGFLGYPEDTRRTVGSAFMATPYPSFGEMVAQPLEWNGDIQIGVRYPFPSAQTVDPHGLSGSGLWISGCDPSAILWRPSISLIGLVTHFDPKAQVLIGYRVETLIDFLQSILK